MSVQGHEATAGNRADLTEIDANPAKFLRYWNAFDKGAEAPLAS